MHTPIFTEPLPNVVRTHNTCFFLDRVYSNVKWFTSVISGISESKIRQQITDNVRDANYRRLSLFGMCVESQTLFLLSHRLTFTRKYHALDRKQYAGISTMGGAGDNLNILVIKRSALGGITFAEIIQCTSTGMEITSQGMWLVTMRLLDLNYTVI